MRLTALTAASEFSTVTATLAALSSTLVDNQTYAFCSSTACWARQGTCKLVTCVAKANFVDTDFMTITIGNTPVIYEFDTAGDGVAVGHVQVNISGATTAASVAAILRTAILANQSALRVIDPTDGTLFVDLGDSRSMVITENVANAGFTIGAGTVQASVAAGSMFIPPNTIVLLDGHAGAQVGVIRDAADGKCSLTRSMNN